MMPLSAIAPGNTKVILDPLGLVSIEYTVISRGSIVAHRSENEASFSGSTTRGKVNISLLELPS